MEEIVQEVKSTKGNVIFLTGAGLSADSGIPTFRGPEGFWTVGSKNYMPAEMATQAMFQKYPEKVWEWYLYRFGAGKNASPNRGHQYIVKFEELLGDRFTLVSQNIDGLHQKAGNSLDRSFYIHGNSAFMRCANNCTKAISNLPSSLWLQENVALDKPRKILLSCQLCGAWMRPHVLWFDETYDEEYYKFETVLNKAMHSDLLFLIGTSGATTLPTYVVLFAIETGAYVVEINTNETQFTELVKSYDKGLVQTGTASMLLSTWLDEFNDRK